MHQAGLAIGGAPGGGHRRDRCSGRTSSGLAPRRRSLVMATDGRPLPAAEKQTASPARPPRRSSRRPRPRSRRPAARRGEALAGLPGHRLDLVDARAASPGHDRSRRPIRPDRVRRRSGSQAGVRMTSGMPGGFGAIQLVATAEGFGPTGPTSPGPRAMSSCGWFAMTCRSRDGSSASKVVRWPGSRSGRSWSRIRRTRMTSTGLRPATSRPATTDADGRFRLRGSAADRRAVLGIAGPGHPARRRCKW